MQRPKTAVIRRPRQMSGLSARTPKEAAIRLVRLEFDRSRLDLGIAQAEARMTAFRRERDALDGQRRKLLSALVDDRGA